MASRKRKQIPLCRSCHMDRHSNKPSVRGIHTVVSNFQSVRFYHYYSLKRKGKQLTLYSPRPLAIIVYVNPLHNDLSYEDSSHKTIISKSNFTELLVSLILGVAIACYLITLIPGMDSESINNNIDFNPIDICINNFVDD